MRNTQGYTLIEIMITIGVLGILILGVVYSYSKYNERSQAMTCRGNIRLIYSAVNEYALDYQLAPGATVSITNLCPHYLSERALEPCPYNKQSYGGTFTVGQAPQCPAGIPEHAWSPDEDIGL